MNILLIQPPVRDFYQTKIRTQPIGLAYLASSLKQQKHCVEILDCHVPGRKEQISIPENLSYIKQFYRDGDKSPFRLYSKFFHFGLTHKEISEHIKNSSPQVVGISCQFTPYINEAFSIAEIVKSIDPNIPVIFGGAHASSVPEDVLENRNVDYVIIGEGEETLPGLVSSIEYGKIPWKLDGVGYKIKGDKHIHPRKEFIRDLDSIPFPARDILNQSYYQISGRPYTMLLTSRGCPQGCSYCSVGCVMGHEFRKRSPESILKEIRHCRDEYGISLFDIEDDNFTLDEDRAITILTLIIEEFGENQIKILAMNGLSIFTLNKKILKKMKMAGFQHLDLSLGSASEEANRKMGRPFDLAKAETVLKEANELGFPLTTYIIIGVPGQGLTEMMDSIVYLMKRGTHIGPSIFYPSPGTAVFKKIKKDSHNFFSDYSLFRSSVFPVETDEFSRLDIVSLLRLVRWINFIKGVLSAEHIRGISIEELEGISVSKWWPESVPKRNCGPLFFSTLKPLKEEQTGKILTAFFILWKGFFGIKRLNMPNKNLHTYQVFPYKTSSRVMSLFWNRNEEMFVAPAIRKNIWG